MEKETVKEEQYIQPDHSKHFTVTDISNAIGMQHEEKTMSRVVQELKKVHKNKVQHISVRNGKVFQYYYYIA